MPYLMNSKIIILTGKAQSGKDTACEFINKRLLEGGLTSKIYAFADPLKRLCSDLFNIPESLCWGNNEEKDLPSPYRWADFPLSISRINYIMYNDLDLKDYILSDDVTVRQLLQVWGTNIFREFEPNCWVNATISKIKNESPDVAIISDARFPNEIDAFLDFETFVIRLERNPINGSHRSEVALDDYDFCNVDNTWIIENSTITIEQKNRKLEKIMDEILTHESCSNSK